MNPKSFLRFAAMTAVISTTAFSSCISRTSMESPSGSLKNGESTTAAEEVGTLEQKTGPFSRVSVAHSLTAYYHVSDDEPHVRVSAPRSALKDISVKTKAGTLTLKAMNALRFNKMSRRAIRIDIYGAVPASLAATSSATLIVEKPLNISSSLTLEASKAGAVKATVNGPSLAVNATLNGYVELGTASESDWVKLSASGNGTIKTGSLKSKTTELKVITGGSIAVPSLNVTQTAFFTAASNGVIKVSGKGHETYVKCYTNGEIDMQGFSQDNVDATAATAGKITLRRPAIYKATTSSGGNISEVD